MQAVSVGTENSGTYAKDGYNNVTEDRKPSDDDDFSGIDFDFIGG